jgi:cation diffusion facilitator family transporter
MSAGGGDPRKVVRAALASNLAIACAKFAAAFVSGSAATLAEAIHSLADSGNQVLLFVGLVLAARPHDELHPFGHAAERYFWPFMVAVMLFTVGGAFSIVEGVEHLLHPAEVVRGDFGTWRRGPLSSLLVLGVSVLLEAYSCKVALNEFNRERGQERIARALFEGRDPTIPLVLLEDVAALAGLAIAFVAVLATVLTGDARFDAFGSVGVGLLLVVVAFFVARDVHGLLIGEGLTPENLARARAALESAEGVVRVATMRSLHLGPHEALLGAKVAFDPRYGVAEVEAAIDRAEVALRAAVPILKYVYLEPDSDADDLAGAPSS